MADMATAAEPMAEARLPGMSASATHNLLSGRAIGTTFDVDVKGSDKVEIAEQDPRVRTRLISDEQLANMQATGKVPPQVKSSQKKRTEKGGLLGKLGLRSVESTGMPDAYVKAMVSRALPSLSFFIKNAWPARRRCVC